MSEQWDRLKDEDPNAHRSLQNVAEAAFQLKTEPVPLDAVEVDTEKIEEVEFLEIEEVEFEEEEKTCVSFSDEDVRIEYISRYAADAIDEVWDDPSAVAGAFSDLQHRTTRLGIREEVNGEVIPILAREYDRDVIGKVAEVAGLESTGERHPVMELYYPLSEALPKLQVDPQNMAESLGPVLERTAGGGFLGRGIHGAVQELAGRSLELADELFSAFTARPDSPVISLAGNALLGFSKHDFEEAHARALELTRSDERLLCRVGIGVLGKLEYPNDGDLLASSMERLVDLKKQADPEIDYVLTRAFGNLIEKTDEAKEALIELSSRPDARTQKHLTKVLYSLDDALQESWAQAVLHRLAGAGVEDTTALENLDLHVAQVAEDSPNAAANILEEFASSSAGSSKLTEVFDSTVSTLSETYPEKLETAITEWFASTDSSLHRAASELADHHFYATSIEERPVLALSEEVLGSLSPEEVFDLLRRVVGYVSDSRSLASLISSTPRREPCPNELQQFVADLLIGHVLYNYPGEAREYLDQRLESDDVTETEQEVIQQAFDEIDEYFDQLGELPTLKELRPPSAHLSKIRRARKQQQSKAMEKAHEGSVVQSLFQSVPLKYGSGFYQIGTEGSTEPAPLNKMSSEFEMPRGELIDPVGQAYKRFLFRTAQDPAQQPGDGSYSDS